MNSRGKEEACRFGPNARNVPVKWPKDLFQSWGYSRSRMQCGCQVDHSATFWAGLRQPRLTFAASRFIGVSVAAIWKRMLPNLHEHQSKDKGSLRRSQSPVPELCGLAEPISGSRRLSTARTCHSSTGIPQQLKGRQFL